nr:MAG TPA: hypothetical protein [Caudoviricetes sp.]
MIISNAWKSYYNLTHNIFHFLRTHFNALIWKFLLGSFNKSFCIFVYF